jgi:hypothetical protein
MRPTMSQNKQGRIPEHRGYALPRRETIVGSIRPCLENPGVWGKAPVCTRVCKRPAPWNNLTNPTTITASNYDESQEISESFHDDNLVKRHDDNSAINTSTRLHSESTRSAIASGSRLASAMSCSRVGRGSLMSPQVTKYPNSRKLNIWSVWT